MARMGMPALYGCHRNCVYDDNFQRAGQINQRSPTKNPETRKRATVMIDIETLRTAWIVMAIISVAFGFVEKIAMIAAMKSGDADRETRWRLRAIDSYVFAVLLLMGAGLLR
jgi:hypothetical protein